MKVTSYSRLGNPVGLHPAHTDVSNAWCGQLYAKDSWEKRGLLGPTVYLYPLGVGPKVTEIKDPFLQKSEGLYSEGTKKTQLLHYKLPESILGNDSSRLTRVAHRDGFDSDWSIVIGEFQGLPVPNGVSYHSTNSFTWKQMDWDQEDFVVVTRVYNGWYEWRNDLWWIPENPRVRYSITCKLTKFNRITNRLFRSQDFYYEGTDGPVSRESFDPQYYALKAHVAFSEAINDGTYVPSWSQEGTLTTFIEANQEELPPLLDLFNERHRFYETDWTRQYDFDWLIQHAFFNACQDIKKMNDNSIQNVLEVAKFLWSIATGKILGELGIEATDTFGDILNKWLEAHLDAGSAKLTIGNWGSDWLTYRYFIGTSTMDLQDFSEYLCQKTDLYFKFLNKQYHRKSYGYASRMVNGIRVECRCQMKWRPRALDGLHTALKYIHETGLEFNPYVLWDMIPFSFIVDWFVPIGDVADVNSEAKYLSTEYFDFEPLCFSLKYDMTGHESVGTRYFRWYQGAPILEGYMWFDDDSKTSTKTIVKRTLDTGAITINSL